MANGTSFVTHRKKTIGDVAVDGLLAGMAGGVVMGVVLLLLGLLDGTGLLETLGRFDPANGGSAVVGGLLHLAVSGLYGVFFALVYHILIGRRPSINRYGWLIGAIFGLALWLAAQFVFLPGLNSELADITPSSFALGHMAYGLLLGYLMARHHVN
jgi:uncharacterized BrkB/YihY/UPF0761 family membrane protein